MGATARSNGAERNALYLVFPERIFSANFLVIRSHLSKIEFTTFCFTPGWIEIQLEGRSIGCIPTILNPLKSSTSAGKNCASPLNPGTNNFDSFNPALVFRIKTSVFFLWGNLQMNFSMLGGRLKPWVGEKKPISVFPSTSGILTSVKRSILIIVIETPCILAVSANHSADRLALPVPEK